MPERTVRPLPFDACCPNCDYLLRGLRSTSCPECGRPFDPDVPETYRLGPRRRPLWWWGRRPVRPPVWHVMWGGAVLLVLAEGASKPYGLDNPLTVLCILAAGILFIDWTIGLLVAAVVTGRPGADFADDQQRGRWWRWLSAPLLLILATTVANTDLVLEIRYAASEKALLKATQDHLTGATHTTPLWIGWYHVESISTSPFGEVRFITGQSFVDPVGFECSVAGCRPREW